MGVDKTNNNNANDLEFEKILEANLETMKETQKTAKTEFANVLLGNSDNAHNALIAAEKANIQMQFYTTVRDKALNGINHLLNMQV